jgi:large subunit ribosomal protein L24
MNIKKGDNVIVITGKDKGKKGTIVRAFPKLEKVLIDGVNMHKKHQRARKHGEKGKVIEVAHPIHVSNVKKADK